MQKRLCSLLLALLMVVTMLPTTASAAETASGTCGENLTWTLDDSGTLTISGEGKMWNFWGDSPWKDQRESIKRVVIEAGVTRIGWGAFSGCASLTSVAVPDSVTSIEEYAFSGCAGLTSVTIPQNVTEIGEGSFRGCSSLKKVNYEAESAEVVRDGPPEDVDDDNVEPFVAIFDQAGDPDVGMHVVFGDGVKKFSYNVFQDCKNISKITIGKGLQRFNYRGCDALVEVEVDDKNPNFAAQNGILYNKDMTTLLRCLSTGAESVVIPDSVKTIGYGAFSGCTSTKVTIPESVNSIGEAAFSDCVNLTSLTIPKNVSSIGDRAFYGCEKVTEIHYNAKNVNDKEQNAAVFSHVGEEVDGGSCLIIGAGVQRIPAYLFAQEECCDPDGDWGFPYYYEVFPNISSVKMLSGACSIGKGAFYGCDELESVSFSQGLTKIENDAFRECKKLTSVSIPSSVTSVGDYAFAGCAAMNSLTISEGVLEIGEGAFLKCDDLAEVSIPSSVTSIGDKSFAYCTNLVAIEVDSKNPNYTNKDGIVFSKDMKKLILCPSPKTGYVNIPSGVIAIGNSAFFLCSRLTGVTIPESVATIGENAFYGCSGLTEVTIPKGVKSIGSKAFFDCTGLTLINYNAESVADMDEKTGVFCRYRSYKGEKTKLVIGEGVLRIPDYMFYGYEANDPEGESESAYENLMYSSITSVMIPTSVTEIGTSHIVFDDNLKTVYYSGTKEQWEKIPGSDEYSLSMAEKKYDHSHKYTDEVVSPTCTEKGYTKHTCVCGHAVCDTYVPVKHTYKNGVCTRCGAKNPNNKPAAPAVKPDYLLSTGKPYLKWKAVDGAVKYYVYRSGGKSGTYKYIGTATKLNYTDTTAKPGYYYYYKVKSVNAGGVESDASVAVSALCHCAQPVLNSAQYLSSSGKPYLSWSTVTGASKYQVYRAGSQNGTYKLLGTTTKTNYTDTTASAGYTYYYKVKAVSKVKTAANSAYSAVVKAVSHCARPVVKPDYLASTGKPYLKWSAVTGASKYEVYRAGSQNGTYKYIGSTTKTGYTDTNASAGYAYYYKVKAISNVKSTANSSYSTVVKATCHCAKPVVKIALTQKGKPKLTWNAVAGAGKYEVYRATSKNGTYTKMFTTTNRSYTNTNARAGTTYYYKVKAISRVRSAANSSYSVVKSIRAR